MTVVFSRLFNIGINVCCVFAVRHLRQKYEYSFGCCSVRPIEAQLFVSHLVGLVAAYFQAFLFFFVYNKIVFLSLALHTMTRVMGYGMVKIDRPIRS